MINWCSYCCKFTGETEPYEDLSLSHGMCGTCSADANLLLDNEGWLDQLRIFQAQLQEAGEQANLAVVPELLDRARTMGIADTHLLLGLAAPLLWRIGYQWECGEVTVAEEHRFTAFVEAVIAAIRRDQLTRVQPVAEVSHRVLLALVDGNYHSLGLHLTELWLNEHGFNVRLIAPGLPSQAIVRVMETYRPHVVGLSVGVDTQLPVLEGAVRDILGACFAGDILIGGALAKTAQIGPLAESGSVTVIREFGDFMSHMLAFRRAG